jgi:hypothetical protein
MSKNIIIISHFKDEVVYFYDYIDHTSLLVLVTTPAKRKDYETFNKFVIEVGCRCICLDEPDTFSTSFELSEKSMDILTNLIEYNPSAIITQAKATIDSDVVSRRIYDFIDSLNTNKHYFPYFDLNNKKNILPGANKFMKLYAENDPDKLKLMQTTYKTVVGLRKLK